MKNFKWCIGSVLSRDRHGRTKIQDHAPSHFHSFNIPSICHDIHSIWFFFFERCTFVVISNKNLVFISCFAILSLYPFHFSVVGQCSKVRVQIVRYETWIVCNSVFITLCYCRYLYVPGLGWRSGRRVTVVLLGIFSVASDNSMCPGSTHPLKMSTRILLGVKTAGVYGWQTTTFKCRCHGIWKP
jgi:hypothetical protein